MSVWFHRKTGRRTSLFAVTNLLPLLLISPLVVNVILQLLQMWLSSR